MLSCFGCSFVYAKLSYFFPKIFLSLSSHSLIGDILLAEEGDTRRELSFGPTDRVWAISDIHVDCIQNFQWIENISKSPNDTLLLAGDVCSNMDLLRKTLQMLKDKFR